MTEQLQELSFTVMGHVSRPTAEVYEAVADPETLSKFFTTGGARGRLEVGADVSWEFADFPGRFPVTVVAAEPARRIEIRWGGEHVAGDESETTVVLAFEPVDDGSRTRVRITETAWRPTAEGAAAAFGNCEGWTGMLAAMKAWIEHGVVLRDGFYR